MPWLVALANFYGLSYSTQFQAYQIIFQIRNSDSDSPPQVEWFLFFEWSLALASFFDFKHCSNLVIGSQTCQWIKITWSTYWKYELSEPFPRSSESESPNRNQGQKSVFFFSKKHHWWFWLSPSVHWPEFENHYVHHCF